ncbi:PREDICTED: uncharacterized protein LOC108568354 isoform X2 [Nicrophorus vespilloides]|uniref:Uncharacterized protein LOC108568354 isoform X2 n=1 Tax=Nicrophorus vespilloides TaxID=110193 RepID=A0ABM1NDH8_NICVS|nr:PREDICTED: uncharacterized protein LOC108568354 isoform X2 [Nicrophorus vespilloides]
MERLNKFEQDQEYIVLDKLFDQLTNSNTAEGRLFHNVNKSVTTNCAKKNSSNIVIENEASYVPDVYKNEFDLFNQYFLNLEKSKHTQSIIHYIEKCFSSDYLSDCNLTGCSVFINQDTILSTLTLPEIYSKQVSNKIRFCPYSNKVIKTIAVDNIKEGETLICEKAAIDVKAHNCICVNTMNYECNHCWKPVKSFYTCHECQLAVYCSKACCTEAHNNYHRWDCHAQKTHFFGLGDLGHLAVRMLFCGIKCNFNPVENKYKMLYNLKYNLRLFSKSEITKLLNRSMQIMVYLSKYTELFSNMREMRIMKKRTVTEKFVYLGGLLVRHYAQACVNAVFLPLEDYSYLLETRGVDYLNPAICVYTCNIRHSCLPNVFINYRRNYCIVKALRDIKAGEEILLNVNGLDSFQTILEKYTEELYKCPKCMGPMGRFFNCWKCFKCVYRGIDLELDKKRTLLYNMSSAMDTCRDSDMMVVFLNRCDILLFSQFKQYYYVIVKLIAVYLVKDQITNAIFYIHKMNFKMNSDLQQYSMMRIMVISAVINYIIMYAVQKKGRCAKSLIECCESLMEDLEKSSGYYQYSHQMQQLRAAFNKTIGTDSAKRNFRNQVNDDEDVDDCNEIKSEVSEKIIAAYALLQLAKF